MPSLPPIDDPWVGQTLDERFIVQGLIGRGAMGAIYRCRDTESGLTMAVKIIAEELLEQEEILARFEREIRASQRIRHPNVVRMYGHGRTPDGRRYFGMEYVEGQTLEDVMEDAPLSSDRVAFIGMQVAMGLRAAHAANCVHRDLKPQNILVCQDGTIKVCDFGLSLLPQLGSSPGTQLTAVDTRVGTPMYMAPEYIEFSEADSRTDLYALGVILYEAACGRPPFSGPPYKVLDMHLTEPVRSLELRAPGKHPRWLREAIENLLKKDPNLRTQTALELIEQLSDESLPPPLPAGFTESSAVPEAQQEVVVTADQPSGRRQSPPEPAKPFHKAQPKLPPLALAAVVSTALIWHGIAVGTGTGKLEHQARDLAGSYYANQIAHDAQSSYDLPSLHKRATQESSRVRPTLPTAPPAGVALMAWSRFTTLNQAWGLWLAVQELLLLGWVSLVFTRWRALGPTARIALVAGTACMGAVPLALDLGTPILAPLLLTFIGLEAASSTLAGMALGGAAALFMPAVLAWPALLRRKRREAFPVALATFAAATAVALPLLGLQSIKDYFLTVLPRMLQGDFTGVGMRLDSFSNHALASLVSVPLPGETGQHLSTGAWALVGMVGLGGVAGLWVHQRRGPEGAWTSAVRTSSWMLAVLLLPAYAMEPNLLWALPAMAVAVGAVQVGRLPAVWAVPVGLAIATLLYPIVPLRVFRQSLLLPDWTVLAALFSALKFAALAVLTAAVLNVDRTPAPAPPAKGPLYG